MTLAELRNVYVPEGLAQFGIDCTTLFNCTSLYRGAQLQSGL